MVFKINIRRRVNLKHKRGRLVWALVGTLLVTAIIIMIVRSLSSPAVGFISQVTYPSKTQISRGQSAKGYYSGKYVSFTYPAHYEKIPADIGQDYLEVANFYSTDHTTKKIAVSIRKETLNNDPSINYRKQHTELYREVSQTPTAIVFVSSSNGSEYTTFINRDDKEISISLTSTYPYDFTDDSATIVNSLQWK